VNLDWDALIGTLAPNGRLHVVGAVLEPIPVAAFPLILQQRSVSGSPTGSPVAIETMLDFASRHNVAPQTEHFPMSNINEAFAIWNAGGAHYVLGGASPLSNGFLDATDGTSNIVFEKNLTSAGLQPFNCSSGGALGIGGMTRSNFGAGAHVFHGETFGTTSEADVSMNQGLGACTLSQLPRELFKGGIVHELGHTLGFRHSDQNRNLTASCSGDPTLDCTSNAIMNHILVAGLNGQLQPWDNAALSTVYGSGPACTPPSITQQPAGSVITSGTSAQLTVGVSGWVLLVRDRRLSRVAAVHPEGPEES